MNKIIVLIATLMLGVLFAASLVGCESMIKKILNNGSNGPASLPGNVK